MDVKILSITREVNGQLAFPVSPQRCIDYRLADNKIVVYDFNLTRSLRGFRLGDALIDCRAKAIRTEAFSLSLVWQRHNMREICTPAVILTESESTFEAGSTLWACA